jgi:hypothetical protein
LTAISFLRIMCVVPPYNERRKRMTPLKNMKFRVSSPEQSERLQNVLYSLGYKWQIGNMSPYAADKACIYSRENSYMMHSDDHFFTDEYVARYEMQDTASFIEAHEERTSHNEDTMKAAMAKPCKDLFLEDAYDSPSEGIFSTSGTSGAKHFCPWFENTSGECPTDDCSVLVQVLFTDGDKGSSAYPASDWYWRKEEQNGEIAMWRYSRAEDYFKQPKTIPKAEGENIVWNLANGSSIEFADEPPKRNKYMREIKSGVWIDVYDVLRAFAVTDPCLQHLLKKALAVGQRGHKDAAEDYKDIVDSAVRAQEMNKEWNPLKTCLDFPLVQP